MACNKDGYGSVFKMDGKGNSFWLVEFEQQEQPTKAVEATRGGREGHCVRMSQKKGTDGWNFPKTYQETRLQSSDPRGEPFG